MNEKVDTTEVSEIILKSSPVSGHYVVWDTDSATPIYWALRPMICPWIARHHGKEFDNPADAGFFNRLGLRIRRADDTGSSAFDGQGAFNQPRLRTGPSWHLPRHNIDILLAALNCPFITHSPQDTVQYMSLHNRPVVPVFPDELQTILMKLYCG